MHILCGEVANVVRCVRLKFFYIIYKIISYWISTKILQNAHSAVWSTESSLFWKPQQSVAELPKD